MSRKRGGNFHEYHGGHYEPYEKVFCYAASLSKDVHPDFKFKLEDMNYTSHLNIFRTDAGVRKHINFDRKQWLDFKAHFPVFDEQFEDCDNAIIAKYGKEKVLEVEEKRRKREEAFRMRADNVCTIPASSSRVALQNNISESDLQLKQAELEEKLRKVNSAIESNKRKASENDEHVVVVAKKAKVGEYGKKRKANETEHVVVAKKASEEEEEE